MQSVLAYSNCSIRLGIMIIILESLINVAVLCCDVLAHFFFLSDKLENLNFSITPSEKPSPSLLARSGQLFLLLCFPITPSPRIC